MPLGMAFSVTLAMLLKERRRGQNLKKQKDALESVHCSWRETLQGFVKNRGYGISLRGGSLMSWTGWGLMSWMDQMFTSWEGDEPVAFTSITTMHSNEKAMICSCFSRSSSLILQKSTPAL